MNYDYPHLTVTVHDGVATVLIDNPPVNLMTSGLFRSLAKVSVIFRMTMTFGSSC